MFIILRVKWDNCGLAKAASRQGWTKSKHKNCYWSRLAHDLGFVLHGKWAGLSKKGVSILFNVLCNTHQQENATGPWHDWDFSESSTGFPPQKPRLWSATPMGPIGRRVELCRHFEGRQKIPAFPSSEANRTGYLGYVLHKKQCYNNPSRARDRQVFRIVSDMYYIPRTSKESIPTFQAQLCYVILSQYS